MLINIVDYPNLRKKHNFYIYGVFSFMQCMVIMENMYNVHGYLWFCHSKIVIKCRKIVSAGKKTDVGNEKRMYYDVVESGERILRLRKEKEETREYVARKINISTEALRRIEKGRNGAKIDTLVALAEYYCVTLDYLICGLYEKNSKEMLMLEGMKEQERKFIYRTVESIRENISILHE